MVREVFDFGSSARLSFAIIIIIIAAWLIAELDEAPQQVSEGLCVHLLAGWLDWMVSVMSAVPPQHLYMGMTRGVRWSDALIHSAPQRDAALFLSLTVKINSECLARCVTDGVQSSFLMGRRCCAESQCEPVVWLVFGAGSLGVQPHRGSASGASQTPRWSWKEADTVPCCDELQTTTTTTILIIIIIYMQIRQKKEIKINK